MSAILIGMANEVTFVLDVEAASVILTDLAMPTIERSTAAITQRAQSIANSISSDPPSFTSNTKTGTIRRGKRAIGTVQADYKNKRESYIAHTALAKSKDAGRVN